MASQLLIGLEKAREPPSHVRPLRPHVAVKGRIYSETGGRCCACSVSMPIGRYSNRLVPKSAS